MCSLCILLIDMQVQNNATNPLLGWIETEGGADIAHLGWGKDPLIAPVAGNGGF